MSMRYGLAVVRCAMTVLLGGSVATAQTLDPAFAPFYTLIDHGPLPGVPGPNGGVTFLPSDDNVILVGGAANGPSAEIFTLRFSRSGDGSMLEFECGDAEFLADAHGVTGGIDGGLTYGPGGVLFYTTYSDNQVGQILPGSTGPDRLIDLTPLGITSSTGMLLFVPPGFPGAGRMKIASFNGGDWFDTTVSPAGDGTYDIAPVKGSGIVIGGGPEGAVYVAGGNPGFPADSVLVCEWGTGRVVTYEVDGNGDPTPETQRVFIAGLSGAEGAAIDPRNGDFIFSTFGGGDRLIRVTGFTELRPGDANCDGVVTVGDIGFFVIALTNPGAFPGCDLLRCDVNGDGMVSVSDIGPFVAVLTSGEGCE